MIRIYLILFVCIFSSCSFYHKGLFDSSIQTQVVLSKANYEVYGSVSGYAEVKFFLFMPLDDQELYQQARNDMVKKARLFGFSRAIVNIASDIYQVGIFPIYYKECCRITGDVIWFTDDEKHTDSLIGEDKKERQKINFENQDLNKK